MTTKDIDFEKLVELSIKCYSPLETSQNVSAAITEILEPFPNWRQESKFFEHDLLSELNKYLDAKYGYGRQTASSSKYFVNTDSWRKAFEAGGHTRYQDLLKDKEKRNKEIDSLKFEELEYSVQELKKKLTDYDKIEQRAEDSLKEYNHGK